MTPSCSSMWCWEETVFRASAVKQAASSDVSSAFEESSNHTACGDSQLSAVDLGGMIGNLDHAQGVLDLRSKLLGSKLFSSDMRMF